MISVVRNQWRQAANYIDGYGEERDLSGALTVFDDGGDGTGRYAIIAVLAGVGEVGRLTFHRSEDPADYYVWWWAVDGMVVKPEYRRLGIGTALIKEFQKFVGSRDIDWGLFTDDGAKLWRAVMGTPSPGGRAKPLQWRQASAGIMSADLWRGLFMGTTSYATFEQIKRNPAAEIVQAMRGYRNVGIHWTDDFNSALNFALDRDPDGWAHEGFGSDPDDPPEILYGYVLGAHVNEEHHLVPGTEEHDNYALSDAILDYGIEREVTLRDQADVHIIAAELVWVDEANGTDGSKEFSLDIKAKAKAVDTGRWWFTETGKAADPRRQKLGGTSWRGFIDEPVWVQHDAVIISNKSPRPTYEVYTYGHLTATAHSLAEAKAALEPVYGPLTWVQRRLDPIEVEHYFFGVTDEFTESKLVWVVDELPRLGKQASAWSDKLRRDAESLADADVDCLGIHERKLKDFMDPDKALYACDFATNAAGPLLQAKGYDVRPAQWHQHSFLEVRSPDGVLWVVDYTGRQYDPDSPWPIVEDSMAYYARFGNGFGGLRRAVRRAVDDRFAPSDPKEAEVPDGFPDVPLIYVPSKANDASYTMGKIELGPQFFRRPRETQHAILWHELGHSIDDAALAAGWGWDVKQWVNGLDFNGQTTPGEIVAEAYSIIQMDERAWFERMGHDPALLAHVADLAKAHGLPVRARWW